MAKLGELFYEAGVKVDGLGQLEELEKRLLSIKDHTNITLDVSGVNLLNTLSKNAITAEDSLEQLNKKALTLGASLQGVFRKGNVHIGSGSIYKTIVRKMSDEFEEGENRMAKLADKQRIIMDSLKMTFASATNTNIISTKAFADARRGIQSYIDEYKALLRVLEVTRSEAVALTSKGGGIDNSQVKSMTTEMKKAAEAIDFFQRLLNEVSRAGNSNKAVVNALKGMFDDSVIGKYENWKKVLFDNKALASWDSELRRIFTDMNLLGAKVQTVFDQVGKNATQPMRQAFAQLKSEMNRNLNVFSLDNVEVYLSKFHVAKNAIVSLREEIARYIDEHGVKVKLAIQDKDLWNRIVKSVTTANAAARESFSKLSWSEAKNGITAMFQELDKLESGSVKAFLTAKGMWEKGLFNGRTFAADNDAWVAAFPDITKRLAEMRALYKEVSDLYMAKGGKNFDLEARFGNAAAEMDAINSTTRNAATSAMLFGNEVEAAATAQSRENEELRQNNALVRESIALLEERIVLMSKKFGGGGLSSAEQKRLDEISAALSGKTTPTPTPAPTPAPAPAPAPASAPTPTPAPVVDSSAASAKESVAGVNKELEESRVKVQNLEAELKKIWSLNERAVSVYNDPKNNWMWSTITGAKELKEQLINLRLIEKGLSSAGASDYITTNSYLDKLKAITKYVKDNKVTEAVTLAELPDVSKDVEKRTSAVKETIKDVKDLGKSAEDTKRKLREMNSVIEKPFDKPKAMSGLNNVRGIIISEGFEGRKALSDVIAGKEGTDETGLFGSLKLLRDTFKTLSADSKNADFSAPLKTFTESIEKAMTELKRLYTEMFTLGDRPLSSGLVAIAKEIDQIFAKAERLQQILNGGGSGTASDPFKRATGGKIGKFPGYSSFMEIINGLRVVPFEKEDLLYAKGKDLDIKNKMIQITDVANKAKLSSTSFFEDLSNNLASASARLQEFANSYDRILSKIIVANKAKGVLPSESLAKNFDLFQKFNLFEREAFHNGWLSKDFSDPSNIKISTRSDVEYLKHVVEELNKAFSLVAEAGRKITPYSEKAPAWRQASFPAYVQISDLYDKVTNLIAQKTTEILALFNKMDANSSLDNTIKATEAAKHLNEEYLKLCRLVGGEFGTIYEKIKGSGYDLSRAELLKVKDYERIINALPNVQEKFEMHDPKLDGAPKYFYDIRDRIANATNLSAVFGSGFSELENQAVRIDALLSDLRMKGFLPRMMNPDDLSLLKEAQDLLQKIDEAKKKAFGELSNSPLMKLRDELGAFIDNIKGLFNTPVWGIGRYNRQLYLKQLESGTLSDKGKYVSEMSSKSNSMANPQLYDSLLEKLESAHALMKGLVEKEQEIGTRKGVDFYNNLSQKIEFAKEQIEEFKKVGPYSSSDVERLTQVHDLLEQIATIEQQLGVKRRATGGPINDAYGYVDKNNPVSVGGKIVGPGTWTSDSVHLMASNGEYVINARATAVFERVLDAINNFGLNKGSLTELQNALSSIRGIDASKIASTGAISMNGIRLDGVSLSESSLMTIKQQIESVLGGIAAGRGSRYENSTYYRNEGGKLSEEELNRLKEGWVNATKAATQYFKELAELQNKYNALGDHRQKVAKDLKRQIDLVQNRFNFAANTQKDFADRIFAGGGEKLATWKEQLSANGVSAVGDKISKEEAARLRELDHLARVEQEKQVKLANARQMIREEAGREAAKTFNGAPGYDNMEYRLQQSLLAEQYRRAEAMSRATSKANKEHLAELEREAKMWGEIARKREEAARVVSQKQNAKMQKEWEEVVAGRGIYDRLMAKQAEQMVRQASPTYHSDPRLYAQYALEEKTSTEEARRIQQERERLNASISNSLNEQFMAHVSSIGKPSDGLTQLNEDFRQLEKMSSQYAAILTEVEKKISELKSKLAIDDAAGKSTAALSMLIAEYEKWKKEIDDVKGKYEGMQAIVDNSGLRKLNLKTQADTAKVLDTIATKDAADNAAKDAAAFKALDDVIKILDKDLASLSLTRAKIEGGGGQVNLITDRINALQAYRDSVANAPRDTRDKAIDTVNSVTKALAGQREETARVVAQQRSLNRTGSKKTAGEKANETREKIAGITRSLDILLQKYKDTTATFKTSSAQVDFSRSRAEINSLIAELGNMAKMSDKALLAAWGKFERGKTLQNGKAQAEVFARESKKAAEEQARSAYLAERQAVNINHAADSMGRFNGQTSQTLKSIFDLDQQFSMLAMTVQNALSIYALQQFAHNLIHIGGELEKQQLAMSSILGSEMRAQEIYAKVANLSMISPFTVQDLVKNTKQLSAFGVQYEDLYDTVRRLSDISAAVGVDFGRIAYEYGQMETMGYLDRRHLRMFSMSGVPLTQELRKYYSEQRGESITQHELDKMIYKREVDADTVKRILNKMTDEGGKFYNMQAIMAESLAAKYANLENAWNLMLGEMAISGPGDFLKDLATLLTTMTRQWKTIAQVGGAALLLLAINKLNPAIMIASAAMGDFTSNIAESAKKSSLTNAQLMRTRSLYKELSTVEKGYIAMSGRITTRELTNNKELTKEMLAQLYIRKQITREQFLGQAGRLGFSDSELTKLGVINTSFGDAFKRIRKDITGSFRSIVSSFKGIGSSFRSLSSLSANAGASMIRTWNLVKMSITTAAGAVRSFGAALMSIAFNPYTWVFALIGTVTSIYSKQQEANERMIDLTNADKTKSAEGLEAISKALENIGKNADEAKQKIGKMSGDEIAKSIGTLKDYLKEFGDTSGEAMNNIFKMDDNKEFVNDQKTQLSMLVDEVFKVKEAYELLGNTMSGVGGLSASSLENTDQFFFDDNLDKNLNDLSAFSTKFDMRVNKMLGKFNHDIMRAVQLYNNERGDNSPLAGAKNTSAVMGKLRKMSEDDANETIKGISKILSSTNGVSSELRRSFSNDSWLTENLGDIFDDYFDYVKDATVDAEAFWEAYSDGLKSRGFDVSNLNESQKIAIRMEIEAMLDKQNVQGDGRDWFIAWLENKGVIPTKIKFEESKDANRTEYQRTLMKSFDSKTVAVDLGVKVDDEKVEKIKRSIEEVVMKSSDVSDINDNVNKALKETGEKITNLAPKMDSLQQAANNAGQSLVEYARNNGFNQLIEEFNTLLAKYNQLKRIVDGESGRQLNNYQSRLAVKLGENYVSSTFATPEQVSGENRETRYRTIAKKSPTIKGATPSHLERAYLDQIDKEIRANETMYDLQTAINSIYQDVEKRMEQLAKNKDSEEYKGYKNVEDILKGIADAGDFELKKSNSGNGERKYIKEIRDDIDLLKKVQTAYNNVLSETGKNREAAWSEALESDAFKSLSKKYKNVFKGDFGTEDGFERFQNSLFEFKKVIAKKLNLKEKDDRNLDEELDNFIRSWELSEAGDRIEREFTQFATRLDDVIAEWDYYRNLLDKGFTDDTANGLAFKIAGNLGGAANKFEYLQNMLSERLSREGVAGGIDWRDLRNLNEGDVSSMMYGDAYHIAMKQMKEADDAGVRNAARERFDVMKSNVKEVIELVKRLYSEEESRKSEIRDAIKSSEEYLSSNIRYAMRRNAVMEEYIRLSKLATTDEEKRMLNLKRTAELMKIDVEQWKNNPINTFAMENLGELSKRGLRELGDELQGLAARYALPESNEQMRSIRDMQSKIQEAERSKSFSLNVKSSLEAAKNAAEQLLSAKKRLKVAQDNLDVAREQASLVEKTNDPNAIAASQLIIASAEAEVEASIEGVSNATYRLSDAEKNLLSVIRELKDKIGAIGKMFSDLGGIINDDIGQAMSSLGNTLSDIPDIASNIEKGGWNAASAYASAIVTLYNLSNTLGEAVSSMDYAAYERAAEKRREINDMRDAVYEYAKAVNDAVRAEQNWFGDTALMDVKQSAKDYANAVKFYYGKLNEAQEQYHNKQSGGWGKYFVTGLTTAAAVAATIGTAGAAAWTALTMAQVAASLAAGAGASATIAGAEAIYKAATYTDGRVSAMNNLIIETRKKSNGFWGTGWGGNDQETQSLQSWLDEVEVIYNAYMKYMTGMTDQKAYEKLVKDQGHGWEQQKEFAEALAAAGIDNIDLFDEAGNLNVKLAKAILENETLADKLQGETKATLETLIKYQEQMDEYHDKLEETISNSYSPLLTTMTDAIWDWFDNGTDALLSFKDNASEVFRDIATEMMQTMLLEHVFDKYKDQLLGLYDTYAQSQDTDNPMSERELGNQMVGFTGQLIDAFGNAVPFLENFVTALDNGLEAQGVTYGLNSGNTSGTSKSISGMSEETADILAAYINGIRTDLNGQRSAVEYIAYSELPALLDAMGASAIGDTSGSSKRLGSGLQIGELIDAMNGNVSLAQDAAFAAEQLAYTEIPELNATAEAQLQQLNMQTEYLYKIQQSNVAISERVDTLQNDLHSVIYGTNKIRV